MILTLAFQIMSHNVTLQHGCWIETQQDAINEVKFSNTINNVKAKIQDKESRINGIMGKKYNKMRR